MDSEHCDHRCSNRLFFRRTHFRPIWTQTIHTHLRSTLHACLLAHVLRPTNLHSPYRTFRRWLSSRSSLYGSRNIILYYIIFIIKNIIIYILKKSSTNTPVHSVSPVCKYKYLKFKNCINIIYI